MRYIVVVPITGIVTVEVEAKNEEEALEVGLRHDFNLGDIESWDTHRTIIEGNVCQAEVNEAYVEER